MRRLWMIVGLAIVTAPADLSQAGTAARDPWWASKRYYAELGKRCPQKHLELLPFGDLPDVIDEFSKRLSSADREQISKAAANRCGPDALGASCGNEGFLRVMVKQNRLGEFANSVSALPKHCTAQSECEQD